MIFDIVINIIFSMVVFDTLFTPQLPLFASKGQYTPTCILRLTHTPQHAALCFNTSPLIYYYSGVRWLFWLLISIAL